jgi:hypothetical protein
MAVLSLTVSFENGPLKGQYFFRLLIRSQYISTSHKIGNVFSSSTLDLTSYTLEVEAKYSSETFVPVYRIVWHHNPEKSNTYLL